MNFVEQLRVEKNLLKESIAFWLKLRKYNASSNTGKDIEKVQYALLRQTHTLEKGMSLREPKKGFGQEKALNLLNALFDYANRYATIDREYLQYPVNTLLAYITYIKKQGIAIDKIEKKFQALIDISGITPEIGKVELLK